MTDSPTVHGYVLTALGMVTGRSIYRFTSHGDTYLLTPDLPATYLLQRPADGYSGLFGTVAEAVTHADALGAGEAVAAHRTRIAGHFAPDRAVPLVRASPPDSLVSPITDVAKVDIP